MTDAPNEERAWRDSLTAGNEVVVEDGGTLTLQYVRRAAGDELVVADSPRISSYGEHFSRVTGRCGDNYLRLLQPTEERRRRVLAELFDNGGLDWDSYPLDTLQQVYRLLMECSIDGCQGKPYATCPTCKRWACQDHGNFGTPCARCAAPVAAAGQPPAGTSWAEVTMDLRAALVPTEQESN